jgi:hypothetical protein
MTAFLLPALVVVIAVLVALDVRRNGGWDPWDDFDQDPRG